MEENASAVGAALRSDAKLCRSATQAGFAIPIRIAILSNEINATGSTNPLIWTALLFVSPVFPGAGVIRVVWQVGQDGAADFHQVDLTLFVVEDVAAG